MQISDPDALRLEPFLGVPWGPEWSAEAVIATLEPMVLDERRARILEVIDGRIGSVTVLMDAPNDPHNGAAVMRTADAFGVQIVHVVPRAEGFYVSGGVAKGTQRWIDVVLHDGPEAAVASLREQGFELVATHPQGELVPEDLAAIPKLALVLGNEHDGIRQALARRRTARSASRCGDSWRASTSASPPRCCSRRPPEPGRAICPRRSAAFCTPGACTAPWPGRPKCWTRRTRPRPAEGPENPPDPSGSRPSASPGDMSARLY